MCSLIIVIWNSLVFLFLIYKVVIRVCECCLSRAYKKGHGFDTLDHILCIFCLPWLFPVFFFQFFFKNFYPTYTRSSSSSIWKSCLLERMLLLQRPAPLLRNYCPCLWWCQVYWSSLFSDIPNLTLLSKRLSKRSSNHLSSLMMKQRSCESQVWSYSVLHIHSCSFSDSDDDMRSVKSASSVASKVKSVTPLVFCLLYFLLICWHIFRGIRGRPPVKKEVKTSNYVDDEGEPCVISFICLWCDMNLFL